MDQTAWTELLKLLETQRAMLDAMTQKIDDLATSNKLLEQRIIALERQSERSKDI
ncbi:MAG: hypothetical protein H6877_10100 [Rhodobiaceae bacterium]|nr:hypothetical protein [Rhodobiaceae bacterium]